MIEEAVADHGEVDGEEELPAALPAVDAEAEAVNQEVEEGRKWLLYVSYMQLTIFIKPFH